MEEQFEGINPHKIDTPISYEARKAVEEDLNILENRVKKEIKEYENKNIFSKIKGKIYCENCKFRFFQGCTNKDVLVSLGKFSSSPLKYDTHKFISIYEANKDNDCKYFIKGKYQNIFRKFFKFLLIFIFVGVIFFISIIILIFI